MYRFRNLPIRLKLTLIILLVSSLTLFAAALTIIAYEAQTARERMTNELHGLAELLAVNSRAALEFSDPEAATENLRSVSARHTVISAAVYDATGVLFASYRQTADSPIPTHPKPPGDYLDDGYLELFHLIGTRADLVGTVYLRADVTPLHGLIADYATIVGSMFAVLLLATLGLAALLQRSISKPILDLARVAGAVTARQDYSLRALRHGEDEVGLLTDALNQMLTQIQQQDSALRSAYGELEKRHLELRDEIDERRRAEAAVRTLNAELEQRVEARTAQLASANKELESFSYSVSHDLRAPLRGIDGFSRILEEEYGPQLDAEAHRLIAMVRDNCNRMGQLIDDLLAFSRLGRKPLTTAPVNMDDLVAEVLRELGNIPGEQLPVVTLEPLPVIECDRTLIRQVWFNLISNAIKFSSQQDAPHIRIWSMPEETRTVFAVSDNGVGFDMEYYDKLFGVFQRLHRVDEFPGTGVGLATVQRIVTCHGGQTWAVSKPGEGATFFFALAKGKQHA